jgi:hypothetical protein
VPLETTNIGFNDIRLTNDTGVDGVTNTFAAAIWALDISLRFASRGGSFIRHYSPFSPSNQSILGMPPYYQPSPIYYGLLMANMMLYERPRFISPSVIAVNSTRIKVYAMAKRIMIINKELDSSVKGNVEVTFSGVSPLECVYLRADSLTSKTGITLGNLSFISGDSDYVGEVVMKTYYPDNESIYHV